MSQDSGSDSASGDALSASASAESESPAKPAKKTSPAAPKRDEVVVQVTSSSDDAEDTDVKTEDAPEEPGPAAPANALSKTPPPPAPPASAPAPAPAPSPPPADKVRSDPPWAAATEPPGSVFAGRTDTPPRQYSQPEPMPPRPSTSGEYPTVVKAARPADGKSPRKAHLQLSRFEPLSVMKFSFVMSLVCFVVLLVAVTVLYVILSGLGVFDSISSTINELTQEQGSKTNSFDASSWFSFTKIFGYTALIGGLNVLIITALATVGSVIYNIASDFVGGVEVTLKEAE